MLFKCRVSSPCKGLKNNDYETKKYSYTPRNSFQVDLYTNFDFLYRLKAKKKPLILKKKTMFLQGKLAWKIEQKIKYFEFIMH